MKHRLLLATAFFALAALPAQAQLFGPSDEEVAAQKAHEDNQNSRIEQNERDIGQTNGDVRQLREQFQAQLRDLSDRVRSLTDSLARATGANEELTHQIGLLSARIDQQQKDFNYRLCTLSAQQLGADAGSLNCAAMGGGGAPAPIRPQGPVAPGAQLAPLGGGGNFSAVPNNFDDNPNRGRPPGVLGTLSGSGARPQAADTGGGNDSRQFDGAMNLLARQQYPEAAAAFRGYADSHPEDDNLSSQALYWVGTIAVMQHDNAGAARTFAEQLKKYPKSARAPDATLKLGQVLVAQGQAANGCTAFRAVTRKQYPDASPSTIDAALAARKANNCK